MLDWIIRGATVVDGTGAPGRLADVAIAGGRIAGVGEIASEAAAARTLDAGGRVVAPGFIDIHSHSDFSLMINRRAESSVRQGVTTEVVGNCGMGCAPLQDPRHLPLVVLEYLEGTDTGAWRSFGEWLEVLGQGGLSINVAAMVGHGAVRLAGMGTAGRPAKPEELARMVALTEQSLSEGAFGFSSGLEYTPGKSAAPEELAALAAVAGRYGGLYATHIRDRDYGYMGGVEEALGTAAAAGVSLQISHVAPRWGATPGSNGRAYEAIEQAWRAGTDVWIDNHPYAFGRGLVMSALPPAAFEGGVGRLRERLADPMQRRAMREYPNPQWKHWREGRWDLLTIFDAPHHRDLQGRSIQEVAESGGRDPWDVVCDLLLDECPNPGALLWSAPLHVQDDIDASFRHPRGLIMSDGSAVAPYGPYCGVRHIYAYGWATRILRHYVRERGVLSLEDAVRRISALPARRIGLRDRGVLAPGARADVVLFSPDTVADRATFEQPIAYPEGVSHVWVNGALTVEDGEHTGAMAGEVLRRGA